MNWYEQGIKSHRRFQLTDLASDIDILYPPFAFCILKLFINAYKSGLRVCAFETYRSQERQSDLFDKGKTKLSKNGMHHFGVATDIVFRTEKNQPVWQGNWDTLGKLGKELGLFWGGDWESFRDYPHFQLIPATPNDQAKIVKGDYPSYDEGISAHVQKLIPFYESIIKNNYSEDAFKDLCDCYDNLLVVPKPEVIKTPEPEKVETIEKVLQPETKTENQPVVKTNGLFALIVEFFNKWIGRK